MYEQIFGLRKKPFHAIALGADVFVGPQTAATVAGLKTTLTSDDAIVTVSGPAGSGKTTLVAKALMALGDRKTTVLIGRIRLDINDVLDLLLKELDVHPVPNGTFQKFAAFRQTLSELESRNARLIIVVEDASRLGVETLAELEALTAADAGPSDGANIVLMADEQLDEILRAPQLARLTQRIRQRLPVAPLSAAELRGYLQHCFRLAGGDYEQIFSADATDLLHHLSGGVPRIANNLVGSAMKAAADQNQNPVPSALLSKIASDQYGLSSEGFSALAAPLPIVETTVSTEPEPPAVAEEPIIAFSDESEDPIAENPISELINDTLPDLEILAPEYVAGHEEIDDVPAVPADLLAMEETPEVVSEPVAVEEVPELVPGPVAELTSEIERQLEPQITDSIDVATEESERNPTLAELRPDLDALEEAMSLSLAADPEPAAAPSEPDQTLQPEVPELDVIPEITLDNAISERIESEWPDETGENCQAAAAPNVAKNKADSELESIAGELAKAKSIEDIDDKMAETLFGADFSLIAAQIVANPEISEPANEELEPHESKADVAAAAAPAAPASATEGLKLEATATEEITLRAAPDTAVGGIDLGATQQRLNMVRALNASPQPSQPTPKVQAADTPARQAEPAEIEQPEPIENQINTSITQTLQALSMKDAIPENDSEDEDEPKGGFFSRFKRS